MSLTLTRSDPARNMARFYKLDLQPTLFGDWSLIREWGRIGRAGTVRTATYPTEAEALASLEQARGKKQRRGYGSEVGGGHSGWKKPPISVCRND